MLCREGSRALVLDIRIKAVCLILSPAQSLALFPAQKGRRRARRPQEVASGQGSVSEGPRLPPLTYHLPAHQSLLSGRIPRAMFMPKGLRFPKIYRKRKRTFGPNGFGKPKLRRHFLEDFSEPFESDEYWEIPAL